jgi:hypothetical protein
MGFVAGAYLIGFNAKVCGQSAEGISFDRQLFKRMITGDWMGQAIQDAIYLGMDLTSMCTFIEADAAAIVDIIRPYNGAVATISNCQPGILDVQHAVAKSLVLTSLLTGTVLNANGGSGATSVLPLTRTLPRTILAENYPVRELLGNNLRDVPVKFRHYPTPRTQSTGVGGGEFGTET